MKKKNACLSPILNGRLYTKGIDFYEDIIKTNLRQKSKVWVCTRLKLIIQTFIWVRIWDFDSVTISECLNSD